MPGLRARIGSDGARADEEVFTMTAVNREFVWPDLKSERPREPGFSGAARQMGPRFAPVERPEGQPVESVSMR